MNDRTRAAKSGAKISAGAGAAYRVRRMGGLRVDRVGRPLFDPGAGTGSTCRRWRSGGEPASPVPRGRVCAGPAQREPPGAMQSSTRAWGDGRA